jgi:hypothetical protein
MGSFVIRGSIVVLGLLSVIGKAQAQVWQPPPPEGAPGVQPEPATTVPEAPPPDTAPPPAPEPALPSPAPAAPAPEPTPPAPEPVAPAPPGSLEIAGTQLSFYGFLRLDAIVSDSQLNHPQYSMWAASEAEGDENRGLIDVHPRLTRFGLKVHRDGLPLLSSAVLDGNLEIDFQNRAVGEASGGSESRELPRLRHAFLKLTMGAFSVLAGQTWDLIGPLWPIVNADGMMWNSGNVGDRRPQLRASWEPSIGGASRLQLQVALGRTGAVDLKDADGNGARDGDASVSPMVQGRLGLLALADRLDIGVWAEYGQERTASVPNQPQTDPPVPVTSGRKRFSCTLVGADLNLKLGPVTLSGELFWGNNLSDLRGGIGQGLGKASGDEIEARGGWGNVRVAATSWLALGAGAALDDVTEDELVAGDRRRNLAVYGNTELDAGGGFLVGLDYINWRTEYVERPDGTANRFDLYALYKF